MPYRNVFILVISVFMFACAGLKGSKPQFEIEYYKQFDLVEMRPFERSEVKPKRPYVRVLKDGSGYDSIEIYLPQRKHVSQTLRRVRSDKFEKMYAGIGNRYFEFTIDTLVVAGDELFEFRTSYFSDKRIKEQTILVYKQLSAYRIRLTWFNLLNVSSEKKTPVAVVASLEQIRKSALELGMEVREFYIIDKPGGSIYWSLVLNGYWSL